MNMHAHIQLGYTHPFPITGDMAARYHEGTSARPIRIEPGKEELAEA